MRVLNDYYPTMLWPFTQRGLGIAFGDHQRDGHPCIVGNPFGSVRLLIAAVSGTGVRIEPKLDARFADGLDRRFRRLGQTGGIALGACQQGFNVFPAVGGLHGLARGFSVQSRDFGVDPSGPVPAEYLGEMLAHLGMLQEFFLPGVWGMIFFRS